MATMWLFLGCDDEPDTAALDVVLFPDHAGCTNTYTYDERVQDDQPGDVDYENVVTYDGEERVVSSITGPGTVLDEAWTYPQGNSTCWTAYSWSVGDEDDPPDQGADATASCGDQGHSVEETWMAWSGDSAVSTYTMEAANTYDGDYIVLRGEAWRVGTTQWVERESWDWVGDVPVRDDRWVEQDWVFHEASTLDAEGHTVALTEGDPPALYYSRYTVDGYGRTLGADYSENADFSPVLQHVSMTWATDRYVQETWSVEFYTEGTARMEATVDCTDEWPWTCTHAIDEWLDGEAEPEFAHLVIDAWSCP